MFVVLIQGAFMPAFARQVSNPNAVLPGGFTDEVVVTGLNQPTGTRWTADGRLFVAELQGVVRVFQNGILQPEPFIDLSDEVQTDVGKGLLGMTVHPAFPVQPYVYMFYTYNPPRYPHVRGPRASRLVRVEADPAFDYNRTKPGTEVILMGTNSTPEHMAAVIRNQGCLAADGSYIRDCIPAEGDVHMNGDLQWGPDGMLFAGNGDGWNTEHVDIDVTRALDLNSMAGKVFRIDPITGEGLPDNPFYDGDPNSNQSKVYSFGLRNPYRFAIHPETGEPYIGDVGWATWEEINTGRGANFGWPCYEGSDGVSLVQNGYSDFGLCQQLYAASDVVAPVHAYQHDANDEGSITGSQFYDGIRYPEEYHKALFFGDYTLGWIRYVTFDPSGQAMSHEFATGIAGLVHLTDGPGGDLYYTNLVDGQIHRIRYADTGGNEAPIATIMDPIPGVKYHIGDLVAFTGKGEDTEDGILDGTHLSWEVIQHHGSHMHPNYFRGTGESGLFEYADHDDNTYLELCLTVTDSGGLTDKACQDLQPETIEYTFDSVPTGLELHYAGKNHTTPFTVTAAIGGERIIHAPEWQSGMSFVSWSMGGERTQNIIIQETPRTLVATYEDSSNPPASYATGLIMQEWWDEITGLEVDLLKAHPDFPMNPDSTRLLTTFEIPPNTGDNYGTRVRGYLHPPETGSYQFWIASDDFGELWLSTNADSLNKARIAHVPGWTDDHEWEKYPEQKSEPIFLEADEIYYIEALMKEADDDDNLAVAWTMPDSSQAIIDGSYLSITNVVQVANEVETPLPMDLALQANYPNPFDTETNFTYILTQPGHIRLTIYNIMGQEVQTLIEGRRPAGTGTAVWNGLDAAGQPVSAGVYIVRLEAGAKVETRKVLLQR